MVAVAVVVLVVGAASVGAVDPAGVLEEDSDMAEGLDTVLALVEAAAVALASALEWALVLAWEQELGAAPVLVVAVDINILTKYARRVDH